LFTYSVKIKCSLQVFLLFNAALTAKKSLKIPSIFTALKMEKITFFKYQGAGNDFIIVDPAANASLKGQTEHIRLLCDRRFGIGADGFILWESSEEQSEDFYMTYYNADGRESTLCGNGGRCIVAFAHEFQGQARQMNFSAIDGPHQAEVGARLDEGGLWVRLQMPDVPQITEVEGGLWLDTGSPHHIEMVSELQAYPVVEEGRRIRWESYGDSGSNVNFIEKDLQADFALRTYERGVEDETLACGTGVTAAALAMHYQGKSTKTKLQIQAQGGLLEVEFEPSGQGYKNIWLSGPATFVYKGEIKNPLL
jgi:diaminopimelate epimerase